MSNSTAHAQDKSLRAIQALSKRAVSALAAGNKALFMALSREVKREEDVLNVLKQVAS